MDNTNTNAVIIGLLGIIIGLIIGLAISGTGYGRGMMGMMGMGGSTSLTTSGMMRGVDMEDVMHGMTGSLEGLSGDEFDRAFIAQMIVHHEGAVEMAEAALANAKHDEIKHMARDIISAQTREIEQMQGWQRSWYSE